MKFRITSTKKDKSYDVSVKDTEVSHRSIRKVKDEDVEEPKEEVIETEEVVEVEAPKADAKEEEIEVKLTKKQIEALGELIELLPDLKNLLEPASKEKKEKKEEKEAKSEKEEKPEKEEKSEKEEKAEKESEKPEKIDEADPEILFEESDDKEIGPEEFELEEEDVIEDECGDGVCDSILNPGTIEKQVSDSNKDTVSHEAEVAESWQNRYDALLKEHK